MIEVSKEQFFEAIGGPENIHPRNEPTETIWEIVGTRQRVGRSEPGYVDIGRKPKRYWLTADFAAKKGIRP